MEKKIGIWIDHSKAVIVVISDEGEQVKRIISHVEKHVRFSGGGSEEGSAEDVSDRHFGEHLDRYYDQVVAAIRDGDSILILGPGEAKGELEKLLEHEGLKNRIVGVRAADKLTDRQIAAQARRSFRTARARQSR